MHIPNHIIFGEILPLVPSAKLNEWKVACKSWYYHLHVHPSSFIKDQLAKTRRSHILTMWERYGYTLLLIIDFEHDPARNTVNCVYRTSNLADIYKIIQLPINETIIVGSCNGLVLVNRSTFPEFHLINPSTRQWVTLPLPTKRNRSALTMFGYDKSTDKYKALQLFKTHDFECKVLTLGSKNWKSVVLPYKVRTFSRPNVVMDGYMNILCNINSDVGVYDHLLAFEIGKETFELLKLPTMAIHLLNIHNSLAVIPKNGSSYMYYILDDRKNGTWTKEYSRSPASSSHYIQPIPNRFFPLTMCNDGSTFIYEDFFSSKLAYFDPESFCYKHFEPFRDRSRHYVVTSIICDYVDTLLSPYTVTSKERKFIEDPDSAMPLRRSLRLQKKAKASHK